MQRSRVLLLVIRVRPCVCQRLVNSVAYIDRVHEHIRLMNGEAQYFRTVAAVLTWQRVTVDTAIVQCVVTCRVFSSLMTKPCVCP